VLLNLLVAVELLECFKMANQKLLSAQHIAEHRTPEDCWIVVDKQVWDVTDFLEEHPGGSTSTNSVNEI